MTHGLSNKQAQNLRCEVIQVPSIARSRGGVQPRRVLRIRPRGEGPLVMRAIAGHGFREPKESSPRATEKVLVHFDAKSTTLCP